MNRWFTSIAVLILTFAVRGEPVDASAVIQTVELNAARPYFIPTHPRVTTTVRFPKEIGAPDGAVSVFTEDATKQAGDYLVSWQQGDAYLTVMPLRAASMANLNVPFQGQTYVFYFYQVADELKAVASVTLVPAPDKTGHPSQASRPDVSGAPVLPDVTRQASAPETEFVAPTPARLVGFLDRLKLIHATPPGATLASLAKAMNVQIASTEVERKAATTAGGDEIDPADDAGDGINDTGLYQIVLLRAVRDHRLNCIGFICLIRNTSSQVLAFDVNSFGARAGAEYLSQRISDATPILKPGEQAPAYFAVLAERNDPLSAANHWRISVDLVSPRINPGAALARGFENGEETR